MDYLGACTARGSAAPGTEKVYLAAISLFLGFCNASRLNPRYASEQDIENWRHLMIVHGASANTVMVRLSAVRTLYKALARAGIREDNPALHVKSPRPKVLPVDKIMEKIIFPDQMIIILGKIENNFRGRRDRVILLVMYLLGLRVSEVAGLSWDDFKDDLLGFVSKGGQERKLSVPEALKAGLNELKTDLSTGPMFLGSKNGRLSVRGIQKMVEARLSAVGITKKGPHSFRHSCATVAAMNGVSPFAIQDHLGHSSQRTTAIYTRAAGRLMDAPSNAVARAINL